MLGLYATATSTTALQTCTSDADGDCNFTVANTGNGGANRNKQYYVKQISAPAGWLLNPALRTGDGDGANSQSTAYQFQTPELIGGQTISSQTTSNFMLRSGNTTRDASGGIWQVSKVNPTLPRSCGLDVALVLDLSGSVTDVPALRGAADTLVNALQGTPSRMSLFSFSRVSPAINATQNYPALTSVSTAAQAADFKSRYAGWTAGGGTNWDRGLAVVANAADTPDLTVIITDGSPTYYNDPQEGPGTFTRFRETENGIFSANALRSQGTRVIALGVGSGVSDTATGLNLAAISGPVRYNGTNSAVADYYQSSSYAEAGQALRNLALGNCTGSVSVTKQIVPSGNTGENVTGATAAGAGWVFNGSTSTAGIGGLPATRTTVADGTGAVNFPLTFPGGTTSAAVTLAETQQSGYTLVTQSTKNAVCTNLLTGAAVTVTNSGATGFSINAPATAAVTCTVYNRAPQPPASIVVNKSWVINGTTYAEGRQPDTIQAQLQLTGPGGAAATNQGWGVTRDGYTVGNTATISETVTLPALCTRGASTVVRDGTTTPVSNLPYAASLSGTTNAFTVTNVVTCQSRLTLAKEVRGGTASPTAWTLQAVAPAGALTGPNGTSGSAGATNVLVTPGVTYQLRESGGPPEYAQIDNRTNLESNPLSTGSMTCIEIDANGVQISGFSDGINGGVQVPIGSRVKCTAINQTAELRLAKEVVNDNGGTAVPSDWTLTATPTGTFPAGLPVVTRPGAPIDSAQYVNVRPGVTYNLTESGLAGYQNTRLQCQIDGPATDATSITLRPLQSGTCFFVNEDRPATLTLVKVVDNGTTGATAVPADWTLRAAGAVTVTGPGNSAAVTSQTVPAGSYSLAESGGPSGYTASAWSCTGGTLTGTSVVVANGANVTCTITNTAAQPRLTLVKVVDNGTTGATTAATAWTMTATGPSTVTGVTGAASVTNAAVPVGTFNLSEAGPAGYSASNWVCTGAASSTATSVTLALASSATCTITNTAIAPRLTLVKQVVNANGGTALPTAWTLTGAGPVTITGTTGSAAVTNAAVRVGAYTLSESTGPAGYTPSAWTCTGGTLSGSTVTVALATNATCTITNTDQPATLTLVKRVDNGTTGGTGTPANWTLTATGPATVTGAGNSAAVTNQTVPAGSYTLLESGGLPGYTASDWSCTGGALVAGAVTVPNGGNVTCTITNTAVPAHLTLVKQVVNQAGGTAVPTAWTLTAAGSTTITGATGSGSVTNVVVPIGPYTLSETGPAGYSASAWSCTGATVSGATVTVPLGANVICTIVNTDQPATLTLVKVVDNGTTGASATPANWTLSATGPTTVTGPGNSASVTNQTVPAGSYSLAESGGPAGYTASSWSCTGGTLTGTSVAVANGGSVTCTITNTAVQPRLTLVKVVDNANTGATTVATAWTLTAAGPSTISGATGSGTVTNATVPIGTFNLSETGPAGYTASSWLCTGGASATATSVTLGLGSSATCTITNTAIAPRLTLVKRVVNQAGGTAVPTAWTLTGTGPVTITGASGSDAVTNAAVRVGGYALTETNGPPGYSASTWSCDGGILTGANVTLALGTSATCTITNTDQPATLTLVKRVDNGTTGGTGVPANWTLSATGPITVTGPGNSAAVTNQTVPAGSYTLLESGGLPGYTASSWTCTGGALVAGAVTVPNGGNVTCTITNTAVAPILTLRKEVVNANGGTAVPTDWTLTGAGPVTITGATGSIPVTGATVPAGNYTLSEAGGPTGYTASSWNCGTALVNGSTVTVPLGQNITCTIVNTDQPASLTLVKVVDNGTTGATATPANWTLTASGTTTVTGPGNSPSVTEQTVPAGSYALSESGGPAGYTASAWTCAGGTLAGASVTVPNGGNVTCTITNTAVQPTLTLVKVVDNGDTGATTAATAWTLSAAGPGTISGATGSPAVTTAAVPIGTFDLSETGPAGYTASEWVCTGADGSTATSVTLGLADAATCTITNTAIPPTLTLEKGVVNDNGGTAAPTEWTLTGTGPQTITGTTGSPAVTGATVRVGDYTLSEAGGPTGYTASDWSCVGADLAGSTVTVPLGANATCTIVNNDQPAQLSLVKVVENGTTGATAAPANWTLTASGTTTVTGPGNSPSVTEQTVPAGSYALSESGGPAGYTASAWSCSGGTLTGASVSVPNGGDVTCTITNTAIAPTLTLVKVVDNGNTGATTPPTAWTLTADGPSTISGATGSTDVTDATARVGTYDLSESTIAGYSASDWVCTGGADTSATSVTLAPGNAATCTIANTAIAPTLTLVKRVSNNFGGTAVPTDWTLTGTGPVTISGASGSDPVTAAVVQTGDYNLSESGGPGGYTAGDWNCGAADLTGSTVTVPLDSNITCTIVNSDQPAQLTLVKVVDANNSGSTKQPSEWTLTATPQGITGQDEVSGNGDPTSADGVNAVQVFAGDYQLDEDGPGGFEGSLWECTGGVVNGDVVTVPNGGNVTCTITNTAVAPTLTLVKQINDPGNLGTAQPTDWTLSADGPSPITGATGSPSVTNAAVEVGGYDLSETGPVNYTASAWTCVDADRAPVTVTGTRITLAEGDHVTCTIVNTPETPDWAISKSSDPASGSTVQPGDQIVYTATLIRGTGVAPQNVVVNDNLSDVLDNATLVSGPTPSTGTATLTGTALTWTVPTLTNPTETVTYTVRVNDGAWGVTLRNQATSPGSSPCVPAGEGPGGDAAPAARAAAVPGAAVMDVPWQNGDCPTTTEHFTPAWELTKTSDPASGSTVDPGDSITYTLTATNTSTEADLTGAVATDDLSNVLNHASLDSVPAAATLSGTTLTWNIPDLGPGESATLTYAITVNKGAYNVTIGNVATPGAGGICPDECSTDHRTPPPPNPPLPQTGSDASLQGLLIGLGLAAAGAVAIAGSRRRRRD